MRPCAAEFPQKINIFDYSGQQIYIHITFLSNDLAITLLEVLFSLLSFPNLCSEAYYFTDDDDIIRRTAEIYFSR